MAEHPGRMGGLPRSPRSFRLVVCFQTFLGNAGAHRGHHAQDPATPSSCPLAVSRVPRGRRYSVHLLAAVPRHSGQGGRYRCLSCPMRTCLSSQSSCLSIQAARDVPLPQSNTPFS